MKTGDVVISIAGKDKGTLLAVLCVDAGKIVVTDGRKRKRQKPKYKNPKHLKATGLNIEEQSFKSNKLIRQALNSCKDAVFVDCDFAKLK